MDSITGTVPRRGWYHGWNIVGVAILAGIAANGLTVNAFSLFLNDWSAQLHSKISTLQLGLAAMGLGSSIVSPVVGTFADKYQARWLFVIGLAGLAIMHVGVSFMTVTWQFLSLFGILLPISVALSTSLVANTVVSRWFVRRLGMALGITALGLGMAGVILPPIIAVVMPVIGWRGVWRAAGLIIAVVIIPAVIFVVRDHPTERDGTSYLTGVRDAVPHHGIGGGSDIGWRDIFGRRNFWLLLIAFLPMLGLYGGCSNNLGPIVVSRGFSTGIASGLLSAYSVAYLASTLAMGMLTDRFGHRLPLFGLTLATGAGGLIFAFANNVPGLGIGIVMVGLGGGLWPLVAAGVATEFGAKAVGRAFGMLMFFIPFIILVPFVVAKSHEVTGSYVPGLAGVSILTALSGCACLFMRPSGARAR